MKLYEAIKFYQPLTPRSDKHVTSPYNIHKLSSSKNTQTHHVQGITLITHQILTTNLQVNV